MKRKLIAIACTIAAIVVIVIIFWLIVISTLPIDTTILDIASNPEAWLDKKVRVNGTLEGPLMYLPERKPPYNFALYDKDNRTISIGVLGSGGVQEAYPYVTLVGVVKAGRTVGFQGGDLVYYIEAEKAAVLAFPITFERISFYKDWIWNKTNSTHSYSYSNDTHELRLRATRNDAWESVIIQQGMLPHNWTYLNNVLMNSYDTPLSL